MDTNDQTFDYMFKLLIIGEFSTDVLYAKIAFFLSMALSNSTAI